MKLVEQLVCAFYCGIFQKMEENTAKSGTAIESNKRLSQVINIFKNSW
jgi:hypothetical protein